MNTALMVINFLAGAVVLLEALGKLERVQPLCRSLHGKARVIEVLKAAGWFLLALAAGGALVDPLMAGPAPSLEHVASLCGAAVLVIRTRVRESAEISERSA